MDPEKEGKLGLVPCEKEGRRRELKKERVAGGAAGAMKEEVAVGDVGVGKKEGEEEGDGLVGDKKGGRQA